MPATAGSGGVPPLPATAGPGAERYEPGTAGNGDEKVKWKSTNLGNVFFRLRFCYPQS